jgi:hypothetical protein
LRQLSRRDVRGWFEPAADLAPPARSAAERAGITFAEEREFDNPGPTQWAAVELEDGSQYLLVHHYAHPDSFVELRARPGSWTPREAAERFAGALGLEPEAILHVQLGWPGGTIGWMDASAFGHVYSVRRDHLAGLDVDVAGLDIALDAARSADKVGIFVVPYGEGHVAGFIVSDRVVGVVAIPWAAVDASYRQDADDP